MAKLIQALGLSLILLTGSVGLAKDRDKKKKEKEAPQVIQIAPMGYERGAHYILNPLKPAYEEYLATHPDIEALKSQQRIKADEYRQKEDEVLSFRSRCDAITNPADPAKASCVTRLQILQSELETLRRAWSEIKVAREERARKLRSTLTPPLRNIFEVYLGILLNFSVQNYAYVIPPNIARRKLGSYYSADDIRKNFSLYAITLDYHPYDLRATLKMVLQIKGTTNLYNVDVVFRTPNGLAAVEGALYMSNGLLITDPDILFKSLRDNIVERIVKEGSYQ